VFVMSSVFRCTALAMTAFFVVTVAATAQDARFFRIGTGGIGGTYYPIGGIIASAISSPPGSRACDEGGSCGVQDLVAIAQTSDGSVANVEAVAKGRLDSGFVQSDVAYWAYTGTGTYRKKKPRKTIRAIANLYPESVHVVVRIKTGVKSMRGLKGRRVSLDEKGSGTLVDARLILKAYGLREGRDLKAHYLNSESAALRLAAGKLDAFIAVAGYPMASVQLALEKSDARILPLTGKPIEQLLAKYKFFSRDTIPAGIYGNDEPIPTISVNALWIVPESADEELVYQITKAIWNKKSRKLLDEGHAKGKLIQMSTALQGVSVPLHPGAQRFYREVDVAE
jgi:uncharacterized protein